MGAGTTSQVEGNPLRGTCTLVLQSRCGALTHGGATQAPVLSCAFFAALKVFEGQTGDLLHVCQVRARRRSSLAL